MRKDMAKVVTERRRVGGRIEIKDRRKFRRGANFDSEEYDDLLPPNREKIRQKWFASWNNKEFSDLLGPLRGFLFAQIGRPWDDVFSEICKNLPASGLTARHIRGHVLQMVETHTVLIDDVVCYGKATYGGYGKPVTSPRYYNHARLYVHPTTGLLCKAKRG